MSPAPIPTCRMHSWLACLALAALGGALPVVPSAHAADTGHSAPPSKPAASSAKEPAPAQPAVSATPPVPEVSASKLGDRLRAGLSGVLPSKQMTVVVQSPASTHATRARAAPVRPAHTPRMATPSPGNHGSTHTPHWSYDGEGAPPRWGDLQPEFRVCATGKRQSPIAIEEGATLQGPAESLQFAYHPSNASVVNNGHTIQVDVQGDNQLTVRGSAYRLLQFHFHTPSEEQVHGKHYPLVAHLVHKSAEGQLAVVAVLLDDGAANAIIDKVWTYMPLDVGDRVRMPAGLLNLADFLPGDQRYYQFMGSLTTPPCSENVLWMVLKTPVSLSKAQHKLFTQLYPHNARPVQPLHGRVVREAQ